MTATTTVRCDRCDRAFLTIEPGAGRVLADNSARRAGWSVQASGAVSTHVCPVCVGRTLVVR